jgi:dihydroorotate dehydrogenase (fumarate)
MADLSTRYMGLSLKNPFIVSSSGFTRSLEGIHKCEEAGAAAVVLKSLFEEEIRQSGGDIAQSDYYHTEAYEYLRSEVELEWHAEAYFELIRKAKEKSGIPIIASLNCGTDKWWVQYAKSIANAGADALELNLYFLELNDEVASAELEKRYTETIKAVVDVTHVPVSVKLGRYFTALPNLVAQLDAIGVAGVVLFNRFVQPDIDLNDFTIKGATFFDDKVGMHHAFRWISFLHGKVNANLAGSGGVKSHEDLLKYILAGARAVESCSVIYEKGMDAITSIDSGTDKWLDDKGIQSVASLVGKASYANSAGSNEYLRAQFVKQVVEADGY